MTATPTTTDPNHHIELTLSGTTVGLIAVDQNGNVTPRAIRKDPIERINLRTSSGDMKYSDFSYPYVPIAQDDWSGGLGQEDFDDLSKYSWGYNVNTIGHNLIMGPLAEYGYGYRDTELNMPHAAHDPSVASMGWRLLYNATGYYRYVAVPFNADATYAADKAYAWVRKAGTPNGVLTVSLHVDSGNTGPHADVLKSATLAVASQDTFLSMMQVFDWTTTTTLTDGTKYWIKFAGASGDDADNHWQIGGSDDPCGAYHSTDNSNWTEALGALDSDPWYRIVDADDNFTALFYEYKGALYCVTQDDDYTAARIFINGARGAADSNSGDKTKLNDSSAAWTAYAGCIVKITAGTGHTDEQNWRRISTNTATALTVSPAWTTTHDTTTEYVILGSRIWTEMTGHGLTVPVTDVCVSKDVVYYAQGDGTTMRRYTGYTTTSNGGVWTNAWAADGSNKATYFEQYYDSVSGWQVWKANSADANSIASIARATAQTWGTDLTFGTAIPVGDSTEKINGLEMYGEPENLWVLKEGSVWEVIYDVPAAIPLREMGAVASQHNGKAHLVHDVYLYFSLLDRVQRYYRSNLDDIGPNIDEGMPTAYRGHIAHMVGYPGTFFAACNASDYGFDPDIRPTTGRYSSVLAYNGAGWSCLWRAPQPDTKIKRLHAQVIPGARTDLLWVSVGSDLVMLQLDLDPIANPLYKYTHESILESSWNYSNLKDVNKYYKSFKVFSEKLLADKQLAYMHYKKDGDTTWTAVGQTEGTTNLFDESPVEEKDIGTTTTHVYGKRIKYRITLRDREGDGDIKGKSVVLENVPIVPPKYSYSVTFLARDEGVDLQGDDEVTPNHSIQAMVDQLDTWAEGGSPVTMRCVFEPMDNKVVFVQPYGLQPKGVITDEGIEVQIATITLIQA